MFKYFILIPVFFLMACGEEENSSQTKPTAQQAEDSKTKLQGSWIIRRGTGEFADRQVGQVYTFKDNRFQFNKGKMYFMGTVQYEAQSFILTPEKNNKSKRFFYEMKSDTLIMKMEGSDFTFYLTKIITN